MLLGITLAGATCVYKSRCQLQTPRPERRDVQSLNRLKELPKQNVPAALQALALMAVMGYVLYLLIRDNLPRLLLLPLVDSVRRRGADQRTPSTSCSGAPPAMLFVFGFDRADPQSWQLSQATPHVEAGNPGRNEGKRRQPADQGTDPPSSPRAASPPHDAGRPDSDSGDREPHPLRSCNSV